MDTEISIGFNRATGKFNFLEKGEGHTCWWPIARQFDTLPEAEAALDQLRRSKWIDDIREEHYPGKSNLEVSYLGSLPIDVRPTAETLLGFDGCFSVKSDGTVWFDRSEESSST